MSDSSSTKYANKNLVNKIQNIIVGGIPSAEKVFIS